MSFRIDRKTVLNQNALEKVKKSDMTAQLHNLILPLMSHLTICLSICTHAWTNMTFIMSTSLCTVQAHVCVYDLYICHLNISYGDCCLVIFKSESVYAIVWIHIIVLAKQQNSAKYLAKMSLEMEKQRIALQVSQMCVYA